MSQEKKTLVDSLLLPEQLERNKLIKGEQESIPPESAFKDVQTRLLCDAVESGLNPVRENSKSADSGEDIAEILISQLYNDTGTGGLTHDEIKNITNKLQTPVTRHHIAYDFDIGLGRAHRTTNQSSHGHGHDISTNGRGHKKVVTGKAGNKYPVPKRRGVK